MEKAKAWRVGDKLFATAEEAQTEELDILIRDMTPKDGGTETLPAWVVPALIAQSLSVINILSMKSTSHPKARKANGAVTRKKGSRAAEAVAGGTL